MRALEREISIVVGIAGGVRQKTRDPKPSIRHTFRYSRAKSLFCYSVEDGESDCVSDSGCSSSDLDSVVAGPVSTSSKCV